MFKSITFKLWFTLSLTLVLMLFIASGIAHFTFQKRFISHSFDLLKEQLDPLEDKIIARYEVENTLQAYEDNLRLWHRTIRISLYLARKIREFNAIEGGQTPPPSKGARRRDPTFRNPDLQRAQERFARTLSLYSPAKRLIVGGNLDLKKAYMHPVIYNDELIAFIAFEKPVYVLKETEARFLKKQLQSLIYLSLMIAFTTLIVSAFISRWFLAPINKIRRSVGDVAAGDYSSRVEHNSKDELGVLVSNYNNMLEQLNEHENTRKQWVADISHEMRTPVAVLKAQIQAMLDGIRPLDTKNIELLRKKTDALGRLIEDLHELTMADTGALSLNLQHIDFSKIISDFIEENAHRADTKNLRFEFISNISGPAWTYVDIGRIKQILGNIFENSLRYTNTPGHIAWSLQKIDGYYCLHAEDSAPSVESEEMEKIFDRLYRVDKSRNKVSGGSGLGLSLSRNLAAAHNGDINATQSSIGGIKIILRIPESDINDK
jgi:two-component system sensor histidine kinase BaeS